MVEKSPSTAVRLSLLEADMSRANNALEKLQTSMETHRVESSAKMDDLRDELKEDISHLKTELEKKIEAQNVVLKKIEDKLDGLDKWRWIVVGMATVAGYILSKIFGIKIG